MNDVVILEQYCPACHELLNWEVKSFLFANEEGSIRPVYYCDCGACTRRVWL